MELHRLQKLAGLPLSEAKTKPLTIDATELTKYTSSDEFEDAYANAIAGVHAAKDIFGSKAMQSWMQATEENFGVDTLPRAQEIAKKLNALSTELHSLFEVIVSAGQ